MNKLRITSIFKSINGEVNLDGQGSWAVFIRLNGCMKSDLRCTYCDTTYSFSSTNFDLLTVSEILDEVRSIGANIKRISITGGEPLLQDGTEFRLLLRTLLDNDYQISIETNGTINAHSLIALFPSISFVFDYKLKSAGKINSLMKETTFSRLTQRHFIKFIISNKEDFDEALEIIKLLEDKTLARMYFSPAIGNLEPSKLFEMMKSESDIELFDVGYNLQIHKFLFSDDWREEEK